MLDTDTKRRSDTARDIFKNAFLPYRDPETLHKDYKTDESNTPA